MSTDSNQCRRSCAPVLFPTLALLILFGAGCSEKDTTATQKTVPPQAPAQQITETETLKSAAELNGSKTASADGQKVYQGFCQTCHVAGVAGAPKLGDKDAWAPRIAKGNDVLFSSVKNGLKAMPPKGTCMSCSEDELRAAMEYMIKEGS